MNSEGREDRDYWSLQWGTELCDNCGDEYESVNGELCDNCEDGEDE